MIFYFSLGILILTLFIFLGASSLGRRFFNIGDNFYKYIFKYFYFASIIIIFFILIYQSFEQYQLWKSDNLSKYLLPPYVNINYFFKYVGFRFFGPYLISFAASILLLFSLNRLNKKYEERFFYSEEPQIAALAMFLSGWPGCLFYFIGLILAYLIIHFLVSFYYKFFLKIGPSEVRVSLRYWWIPMAIVAIIINKWLVGLDLWKLLKI
ncbi:hypothetical protein HZC33_01390 [Candidatus Wolfebacteria bacterium]|nr:hypothetical protein [Candidatus Wolfebacteria bacterium]